MEKELRIGDGFDPKSTQGPLINQRAVEKVHQVIFVYLLRCIENE
jgi:acyl-CoA reductase-like NAD-dependent aldehyde dehydrogenase